MTTTREGLNLGPLTTTFVYPSSCGVAIKACRECDFGWQAQTCSNNDYNYQGVQDNAECWPDRASSDVKTPVQFNGWGYYSPGLYCPEGYHTACSATGGNGSFSFQFAPLDAETAIGCCPEGFRCELDAGRQTCRRHYTTGSFPVVQCRSGTSDAFSYQSVPATVTSRQGSTVYMQVASTYTIQAPMIQLVHRQDDLPPMTSTPTSTSTATTTAEPSADSDSSDSLATGAIAGIAVGATLVVIGFIAVILSLLYRRRRKTREAQPLLYPSYPNYPNYPNPDMNSNAHFSPGTAPVSAACSVDGTREICGTPKVELQADCLPVEMDGTKPRGELES